MFRDKAASAHEQRPHDRCQWTVHVGLIKRVDTVIKPLQASMSRLFRARYNCFTVINTKKCSSLSGDTLSCCCSPVLRDELDQFDNMPAIESA